MTDPIPATPTGRRLFIYEPHADDKMLFFGWIAAHHVLAYREVHVVLMSNGSTSNVFEELNGLFWDSTWWGGYHYPAREGYQPLTRTEFGLARTREWANGAAQLGIPPTRLHYGMGLASSADLPDAVSKTYATEVMQYWADQTAADGAAAAGHYTMWWKDKHADHAACGQALYALHFTGDPAFYDTRWATKPEDAAAAGAVPYLVPDTMTDTILWLTRRGGRAFGAWDPPNTYAIGYHSVYNPYFSAVERGDPNHIVRL